MLVIQFLYFIPIFIIGFFTIYEDNRTNKIRNKWILFGLVWGASILFFLILWNFVALLAVKFNPGKSIFVISLSFFSETFFNFIFSSVVSFLIWKNKLWAAGDAKLFIVYSFLIPPFYYTKTYLPLFPAFAILTNIFLVAFLYLVIDSIHLYLFKKRISKSIKNDVTFFRKAKKFTKWFFNVAVSLFFVYLIIIRMVSIFRYVNPNFFDNLQKMLMLVLIFWSNDLLKFLRKNKILFFSLLAIYAILAFDFFVNFDKSAPEFISFCKGSSIFLGVTLVIGIFATYFKRGDSKQFEVESIFPGLEIRDTENKVFSKFFRKKINNEEIKEIKKIAEKNNIKKINIVRYFPFAVWIFLGVLATILFRGSVFNIILKNLMTN